MKARQWVLGTLAAAAILGSCRTGGEMRDSRALQLTTEAPVCQPIESFGAIANDGLDDRLALQAALNAGCVSLGAGRYDVFTPPQPRALALLVMPANARIEGIGPQSELSFSGDPAGRDWRGIQVGTGARIHGVLFTVRDMTGPTSEQTHVLRADGPASDIVIDHNWIDHPAVEGSKRGDCLQFVGYPPTDTTPDRRISGVRADHNTFLHCARSGIGVHSGLHDFSFTENRFLGTSDQDIDFEGSGDIVDGNVSDNFFAIPSHIESGIAIQIQAAARLHIHHNSLEGRGMDLYGCDACELDHNRVTQSVPLNAAMITLRKVSRNTSFHDERWERMSGAGPGGLIAVAQKISAPEDVTIADSLLIQHADGFPVYAWGIDGLSLLRSEVTYDGPNAGMVGVLVNGSAGDTGIRSTDIHVTDTTFTGPLRWVIAISGSYRGVGTLEVSRVVSQGAIGGLSCTNVNSQGTITGPIGYAMNAMPTPQASCAPLISN